MGALGSQVQTASRVGGPAVVSLVPEVIRVGVGGVLNSVVTLSVEPVLGLEDLGPVTALVPLERDHKSAVKGDTEE